MQNLLFDFMSKYVSLTEAEKDAIISLDIFRSVKKRTVLLREGEIAQSGYFVLNGCLRTYYMLDGEEKTTAFYTELEGLTPQSAIDHKPSAYYVECVEDSLITMANPDIEVKLFEEFPKFETLCRILSEELLVKTQFNFDEFKTSSPEQRYLNLLEKRPGLIQRVPQHQLASYLGMKPQSLSRLKARIIQRSRS